MEQMLIWILQILLCHSCWSFIISTRTKSSSIRTYRGASIRTTRTFSHQQDDSDKQESSDSFEFIGKGSSELIEPGIVLVAPSHEYNHFLMRSAVFIYDQGLNEFDEMVTRGVIIDHPTAFTMNEMGVEDLGKLGENALWRGGDAGNDTVMFLHCHGIENSSNNKIGCSGIYEGGLQEVKERIDSGKIDSNGCKFFFNYIEFREKELQSIMTETDSDGDAWAVMRVPKNFITNGDYARGDAWSYLRNYMKSRNYF